MCKEVLLGNSKVPVQQEQQLLLHEIHFGVGKPKPLTILHQRITRPVFVLRGRVVQVLGGENESGQEDAMNSTPHALGNRG